MAVTATIDRFEGEVAVLLVEPDGTPVNVPRTELPEEARQGDVLRLEGSVDREETERRRAEVEERIERLKQRNR